MAILLLLHRELSTAWQREPCVVFIFSLPHIS